MSKRVIFSLFLLFFYGALSLEMEDLVPSPPYIVEQSPTDEILFDVENNEEEDRPLYIKCQAIGNPLPTHHWKKNGKPFHWKIYDGRIEKHPRLGTLKIINPRDDDEGHYQCFAENTNGIAMSNGVFLRKVKLDSFGTQQTIRKRGKEGEPFKLKCNPPNGRPKPVVHWVYLYSNGGFKTINSSRMTIDPEGNLWFSNLTKEDASNNFSYVCMATLTFKHKYTYGRRIILEIESANISSGVQNKFKPIRQYTSRENTIAYRGKQQKLYCIYGGSPLPQTVWSKDGKVIEYTERVKQDDYGKSIIIEAVDFDDEGTYTCEVTNGNNESTSYSIKLEVNAVPYFTVEPERLNKTKGETAEFRCKAGGVPTPEIIWIHNGKPIAEAPPNPRRRVEKNKIIIENLSKNDIGNYGCNATNSLGYVYKDVYLNIPL